MALRPRPMSEVVGLAAGLLAGLGVGLGVALSIMLFAGLGAGLVVGEIETRTVPNEGIHRSARITLGVGLGLGLSIMLLVGLFDGLITGLIGGLFAGLITGLAAGLRFGGRTCLQHLNGAAPWRYVDFLDYAAERLFLSKIGGGYSFIHRLLQDHFATRYAEPSNGTHPETAGQEQSAAS